MSYCVCFALFLERAVMDGRIFPRDVAKVQDYDFDVPEGYLQSHRDTASICTESVSRLFLKVLYVTN